ncbi:hypothetical protein ACTQWD_08120, partial [Collinsella sp. LCP19S3_B6]|uniref:hypothetical protein n=1 Tax=Collinsella sp. LCP19S3_B6 TaxID=3438755 RepID=UPI003F8EEC8F
LEEPDRRLPGLDVVFHSQVDTHKKPPISRVQEMGGSSVWAAAACVLSKKDHCRALNAFCLRAFHNHVAVVGQVQIHRIVSGSGVVRLDGVGRTVVRVDGLLDELFCPLRR